MKAGTKQPVHWFPQTQGCSSPSPMGNYKPLQVSLQKLVLKPRVAYLPEVTKVDSSPTV